MTHRHEHSFRMPCGTRVSIQRLIFLFADYKNLFRSYDYLLTRILCERFFLLTIF